MPSTSLSVGPVSSPWRPAITWRSILLGFAGVVIVCGLTPFNDYALNNTYFVGNNLPLGAVVLTVLFALLVNGPLSRWWPRHALRTDELAVAFAMMLVSCTLPSSGLMRYLPTSLVSPLWHAQSNPQYEQLLRSLGLPKWIFPDFKGATSSQWMNDPIVNGYLGRWTGDGAPPYAAWLRPIFVWGIFIFALYGAMFCMVALVRRQWYDNERLAFPLTQI